jgi:hypothetical protein
MKVIDSIPAPGEVHGCPYRQNVDALTKDLQSFGNMPDGTYFIYNHILFLLSLGQIGTISQVVSLAREGHFQLACARHFELLHPGATLLKLNHPNQYPLFSLPLLSSPSIPIYIDVLIFELKRYFVESNRYYSKNAPPPSDTPAADASESSPPSSSVSLPTNDSAGASV